MRFRASTAIVAFFALPCVLGLTWLGCATADEQVDAVPKKQRDGGVGDTNSSGDEDTGGGVDTAPLCAETGVPNACASAVDLGTLAPGAKKAASNAIPVAGGEFWFKVTFDKLEELTAHPRIRLTAADPGISASVVKSCSGESFFCPSGDAGTSKLVRDFEISYRMIDPSADAGEEGGFAPVGPDPDAGDAFVPISAVMPNTIFIKVSRNAATATSCGFTLDVSN